MNPNGNPQNLAPPFPPGVSGNPGGVPGGKRISTWFAELGQIPREKWPHPDKCPTNARIAMARLRAALNPNCDPNKATEIILERTEGAIDRTLHIKAEGVLAGMSEAERRQLAENYLKNTGGGKGVVIDVNTEPKKLSTESTGTEPPGGVKSFPDPS